MESVLASLLRQEDRAKEHLGRPKVAVGYGACNDLFVDSKSLLKAEDAPSVPVHYDEITSAEQLKEVFAYFFRHGAAAE